MKPQFKEFADRASLMAGAAAALADAVRQGLAARGAAAVALSGGSTPEPAYAALAAQPIDWSCVTFALVDERFVPPSDPGSNEAMLRRALAPALAGGAALAPMWSEHGDVLAAATRADALYAPLSFDFAMLGMGGDAHTASWFPHNPSLGEALDPKNARTVIGLEAPGAAGASARLTLTYAALAKTRAIGLLITGADKRERLEMALGQSEVEAPIAAVLRRLPERLTIFWSP